TVIAINGAAGRMGQRLVTLAREDNELSLGAALESPQHPLQGRDVGEVCGLGPLGLPLTAALPVPPGVDVVVDFSSPTGTMAVLPQCARSRLPLVVATPGHPPEQRQEIEAAAHETPLLMSPNMSLSVTVLFRLVAEAARLLAGKDFDVEILERHHR